MPSSYRGCISSGSPDTQTTQQLRQSDRISFFPRLGLGIRRRKAYQCVLVPCNTFGFVGVGVGEAFDLASLAPEQPVQVGADFVAFFFFEVVALGAAGLDGY